MSKHDNPIEMESTQITIASVQEIGTGKRVVMAIRGVFDSRKGLIGAIQRELPKKREHYDLRTVKYHDSMNFYRDQPQVMMLDCLYDDLLTPDKSSGVGAPVKR
jgi:hypothetical protein